MFETSKLQNFVSPYNMALKMNEFRKIQTLRGVLHSTPYHMSFGKSHPALLTLHDKNVKSGISSISLKVAFGGTFCKNATF